MSSAYSTSAKLKAGVASRGAGLASKPHHVLREGGKHDGKKERGQRQSAALSYSGALLFPVAELR
eukprot:14903635-Alexandrium_andersonii.AAC.1